MQTQDNVEKIDFENITEDTTDKQAQALKDLKQLFNFIPESPLEFNGIKYVSFENIGELEDLFYAKHPIDFVEDSADYACKTFHIAKIYALEDGNSKALRTHENPMNFSTANSLAYWLIFSLNPEDKFEKEDPNYQHGYYSMFNNPEIDNNEHYLETVKTFFRSMIGGLNRYSSAENEVAADHPRENIESFCIGRTIYTIFKDKNIVITVSMFYSDDLPVNYRHEFEQIEKI